MGQQPGLCVAVVTRNLARQDLPQGVAQPLDNGPGGLKARGEEHPCESSSDGPDGIKARGENPPVIHPTMAQMIWRQWERSPPVTSYLMKRTLHKMTLR